MIRIGLIGHGYWGKNLARNISQVPACVLAGVCDTSNDRLVDAIADHPAAIPFPDSHSLISDRRIDAVVIATSAGSHFGLALAALRAGKHVWVEKPMARSSEQVARLVDESERRHLTLMVDHTYLFAPSTETIAQVVRKKQLGRLLFWDSARLNLGVIRRDVNVAWDLASHDFSILDHIFPGSPAAGIATGMGPESAGREHLAHISLFYPGDWLAHARAAQRIGLRQAGQYMELPNSERRSTPRPRPARGRS